MALYALIGEISKQLLTYRGLVLVHDNRDELEFIIAGAKVIDLPSSIPDEERLLIRNHPDFASYRWPLRKSDFRK